jgi:hypothetical protein
MTIFRSWDGVANYKKTSKNGESNELITVHKSKSQVFLQGDDFGL